METSSGIAVKGRFGFTLYGPDGKPLRRWFTPNGTTLAGVNHALSVTLAAGTQATTWYLGLISGTGFSSLNVSDTMSSHSGWTELTSYTESVRQTWSPGAPSGGIIINSTEAVFTINATVSVQGAFLVSNSTKAGTTGTLWATGQFGSVQNLVSGQTLGVKYECTATGA